MSSEKTIKLLVVFLCLAGVALFGYRAVYRALDPATNMDARLVPMGAHVWLEGGNPYDPQTVYSEWLRMGGTPKTNPGARGRLAMVYPLGTYVVAAPVGALPVDLWRPVWNLLNVTLYLATIALVLAIARIRFLTAAGLAFAGCALLMAPSHTNIAVGQTGVLVCFAIVLAQFLQLRGAIGASGIASGVALVLKPQTSLAFFLHDLLRARWRTVLIACITAGALMGVGLGALLVRGINPVPDWLLNLRDLARVSANPFAPESPAHQLINAGNLFHRFAGPDAQSLASALGLAVTAALALVYVFVTYKTNPRRDDTVTTLTDLSLTAVLALIVTYHRLYDATVLLLPLALVFAQHATHDSRWRITLALLLPFFVPVASSLEVLQIKYGLVPAAIYENRWFVTAVLMHQNWCLLLLASWLIACRALSPARSDPASTRSSAQTPRFPHPLPSRSSPAEPVP